MIQSFEHGVVIGKFYPFHKGHYFLLHSASTLAKKVTVVVLVDTKRETMFPFEKRAEFVKNGISIYSPYGNLENISVVPVYHQLETNYDSDETWNGFRDLVKEGISKSEHEVAATHLIAADPTYGERLSDMLGLSYVDLFDDRKLFPVSATMIRNDALAHWDFINPDVKEEFVNRVVILGAESTGTTTLAEDLHANIPSSEMIYEYGREYIQNKIKVSNVPIENLEITSEEIEYFAEKQFLHEENMVKQTGCPFLICDTDAFASQIWHKRYVGIFSGKIEEIVSKQKKRTLYVITSMEDIPLEYDGTRDGNDLIRKEMENDFISGLKKRNQPFIIVKGTRWERIHQVLQKLNLNKEIINM